MTSVPTELSVEDAAESPDAYDALLARLSRQSVVKHFDAYGDVEWDAPDMAIDPADARFELWSDDPLGATQWYQSLPQPTRARLGLDMVASKMKIGLEFENVLKRGLLEFATTLPNGSPEFRYAYHEVIEEAQHSLMFQEFVNRSGFDAKGLASGDQRAARFIVQMGRRFPALFFVFVLGGEDPIDCVQRRTLRNGRPIHPLPR
ncbi:MAG: diiron oxygenase [Acidimicrobiales bacterium]